MDRPRRQRSKSYVPFGDRKFSINEMSEYLPSVFGTADELQILDTQVAGHQFNDEKGTIGLLKSKDGTVLKPEAGQREIQFYERLQYTTEPALLQLKEFCPAFYGTRQIDVNGKAVEFIILENIAGEMCEPCIIDIKIGKTTWDPTASEDKVAREKQKYAQCKNDVGFCLPGFQVYKISTERLHKYNKEYGKRLDGSTVIEALKIYLNGEGNRTLCRELVVNLLSELWKIQKWARQQKSLRLISTSILIAYDCKKLKSIIETKNSEDFNPASFKPKLDRKLSISLDSQCPETYARFTTLNNSYSTAENMPHWHKDFRKITRSHSFHHNYNDYISRVKKDYESTLRDLIGDKPEHAKQWFNVKIVDFAHVFPLEDDADTNFIEGIDSLVKTFENLLQRAK